MELNIDVKPDQEFLIARATAIQSYANLEQSISRLFALLLGTTLDLAGIVFFRISGSWQRNQVIEQLLLKKYGTKFDAYWNGLPGQPGKPRSTGIMALIRQLDETRNRIVHWHTAITVAIDENGAKYAQGLVPPNVWGYVDDPKHLSKDDILEFAAKADFVGRSITMFYAMLQNWEIDEASREIFQRPCVYPPEEGHPLIRHPSKPDTQPQSSEG